MNKYRKYFGYVVMAGFLTGCAAPTITPTYTSTDPELMRIGGEKPEDSKPEIVSMGSYCLQIDNKWKENGKTPDDQSIWTKDSFRSVIPCR